MRAHQRGQAQWNVVQRGVLGFFCPLGAFDLLPAGQDFGAGSCGSVTENMGMTALKLERRHPHIFGDATAGTSTEVLARWEQIKSAERAEKSQHSALDDIPLSLPALMRAHKIQKRCSAVGFDWTSLGPVLDKVHEEIDEVMHEAQQAVVDEAKLEEEMGDLLFATVNLSRHLGVKAETALQKANLKFERRFREVERIVASRGLEMSGIDLDAMEEVWQEVKRQESDL